MNKLTIVGVFIADLGQPLDIWRTMVRDSSVSKREVVEPTPAITFIRSNKNATTTEPPKLEPSFLGVGSIDGYGCWCQMSPESEGRLYGEPIDEIDALCQRLHQSYSCISSEFSTEQEECSPFNVEEDGVPDTHSLQYILGYDTPAATTLAVCEIMRPDSRCAARMCYVENRFIAMLAKLKDFIRIENFHNSGFDLGRCERSSVRARRELELAERPACCHAFLTGETC